MIKEMRRSYKSGLGFGLTSGILTPLGLTVGLYSSTYNTCIIIAGIITISITDAFSDALGIHVSKEAGNEYSAKEIWEATIVTFLTKFFVGLTFIIPFLLFNVHKALVASIVWSILLLGSFSFHIALTRNEWPLQAVLEHLLIGTIVVLITYYVPQIVQQTFVCN